MRNNGKGYSTIHNYASCVLAFYKIHDIALNVTKINKFIPAQKKVRKDRAYTHEEILKLLEIADERGRVIILIMASSGMRLGALPLLRLRNLENNKLTVYEGEREEYFTFITPECKTAIDSYLDFRSRYGETLNDNSPLIREQFNTKDPFRVKKAKQLTLPMIKFNLIHLEEKAGLRLTNVVAASHGFRKFFTTQLIHSKVNPEIREMLLGHKIGLASAYYRPTEQDMLEEYEKAEDNLTIDPSNRLRKQLENAKVEKSRIQRIEQKMDLMEKMFQK
jgi:integrase